MKKSISYLAAILTFNLQLLTFNSSAQYTRLTLMDSIKGRNANGDLIYDGTFLYGMTSMGGVNGGYCSGGCGAIFKIKPDGTGYSKVYDFGPYGGTNGNSPNGSLISVGTFLYGMTSSGGTNSQGTIFKIKPDGTGYSQLLDFSGAANGNYPNGSLLSDGTFLYGLTSEGGTNTCSYGGCGTIFKIKPDGTGFVKLLDFSGAANGSGPWGSLISDGTFLYGMTVDGGINNLGVIFKIKPDGTGFSKLLDFSGAANGSHPYGSLFYDGTFMYGMTSDGGTNAKGVMFKIKPDGTGYNKLFDFTGANGSGPRGSLISLGNFLYGMTYGGGTGCCSGLIFKIKPDGTEYSKEFDFINSFGDSNPEGSLISIGNVLFGMSYNGGQKGWGSVFKYTLVTGIVENTEASGFNLFPNPGNGVFTISVGQSEFASGSQILKQSQYDISIYNMLGEKIYKSEIKNPHTGIDLSKQPAGVYFISIETEKGTYTQKLIINH